MGSSPARLLCATIALLHNLLCLIQFRVLLIDLYSTVLFVLSFVRCIPMLMSFDKRHTFSHVFLNIQELNALNAWHFSHLNPPHNRWRFSCNQIIFHSDKNRKKLVVVAVVGVKLLLVLLCAVSVLPLHAVSFHLNRGQKAYTQYRRSRCRRRRRCPYLYRTLALVHTLPPPLPPPRLLLALSV